MPLFKDKFNLSASSYLTSTPCSFEISAKPARCLSPPPPPLSLPASHPPSLPQPTLPPTPHYVVPLLLPSTQTPSPSPDFTQTPSPSPDSQALLGHPPFSRLCGKDIELDSVGRQFEPYRTARYVCTAPVAARSCGAAWVAVPD